MMKGFYITGTKGSYVELEDGRYADSVGSLAYGAGEHTIEELLEELTDAQAEPEFCDLSMEELKLHVGVD